MERKALTERSDDFAQRRQHLDALDDEQLTQRFWKLSEDVVKPLVDLARGHTSPSIERSVLLRMGFSGEEARGLVQAVEDRALLGKGAGHVVLVASRALDLPVRETGLALMEGRGWEAVEAHFDGGGGKGC